MVEGVEAVSGGQCWPTRLNCTKNVKKKESERQCARKCFRNSNSVLGIGRKELGAGSWELGAGSWELGAGSFHIKSLKLS